jgi:hypothetical protein
MCYHQKKKVAKRYFMNFYFRVGCNLLIEVKMGEQNRGSSSKDSRVRLHYMKSPFHYTLLAQNLKNKSFMTFVTV